MPTVVTLLPGRGCQNMTLVWECESSPDVCIVGPLDAKTGLAMIGGIMHCAVSLTPVVDLAGNVTTMHQLMQHTGHHHSTGSCEEDPVIASAAIAAKQSPVHNKHPHDNATSENSRVPRRAQHKPKLAIGRWRTGDPHAECSNNSEPMCSLQT